MVVTIEVVFAYDGQDAFTISLTYIWKTSYLEHYWLLEREGDSVVTPRKVALNTDNDISRVCAISRVGLCRYASKGLRRSEEHNRGPRVKSWQSHRTSCTAIGSIEGHDAASMPTSHCRRITVVVPMSYAQHNGRAHEGICHLDVSHDND